MSIVHTVVQGTAAECLLNSLDIFTFVVNPMLPPALTANNAFAQKRLQRRGIYCLHTKHINLCGGIDVVAFDKVSSSQWILGGVAGALSLPVSTVCLHSHAGGREENTKNILEHEEKYLNITNTVGVGHLLN